METIKASMTSATDTIIAQVAEGPEGEAVCRKTFGTCTMTRRERVLFGHL